MQMIIIELWPEDTAFDGSTIPPRVKPPTVFKESGWQSVGEMQRELMRRFPREKPQRITNGIMKTNLSYGRTMFVTLEP